MINSLMPLGVLMPRGFVFLCLILGSSYLSANEPAEQVFDLDQLSSQFGRFQVRDPQDESWSLVESGARLGYRGFVWSSEELRFRSKLVAGYAEPLVDHLIGKAKDKESIIIDTRAYLDQHFPIKAIFKAATIEAKQEVLKEGLAYKVLLNEIRNCQGKMQTEGGPVDFSMTAKRVQASLQCRLQNAKLYQPTLRILELSGAVSIAMDDPSNLTYYRVVAEHIHLIFKDGQLSGLRLDGNEQQPAQLDHYQLNEHKSYSARSLHLLFGTASRLKSLKSSSDIKMQSHAWSGKIKACIEPSAD